MAYDNKSEGGTDKASGDGTDKKQYFSKYRDFDRDFMSFYDNSLKAILLDNRRRYRMELKDKKERTSRGLSAIPSVKSTATVDKAVERAIMEYHGDPDAISFTSKEGDADPVQEMLARWLTEDFNLRTRPGSATFPFVVWHAASLTAAFTDGLEAGMIWWNKQSYEEDLPDTYFLDTPQGRKQITEEQYDKLKIIVADENNTIGIVEEDLVVVDDNTEEVVTRDTFWIDQLKPGDNIVWDFKSAFLDVNLGAMCIVKVLRSMPEMEDLATAGVFDSFDEAKAGTYLNIQAGETDNTKTAGDPETFNLDPYNRAEVWVCFEREAGGRWMCEFAIDGECAVSTRRPVNDVFFNGRRVDRLPVVLGTHKMKLWEALGRGEPETIAPIEDEMVNHKNNVSDAAKIELQGRWRLDPESDINIDHLLNARVFHAEKGEFERVEQNLNTMDALRVVDGLNQEMSELVPVGMENRHLVPRGTSKTLGAVQLALGGQNEKLSVQLIVRNATFMEPLLYLAAQMIMAYETDQTVLRIAGRKAMKGVGEENVPQGFPPQILAPGGEGMQLDHRKLDLDVNVKINAGLGAAAREDKANTLVSLSAWRKAYNIPTDNAQIAQQLNVLAGYDPEAFTPAQAPPPPGPTLSGNLNMDIVALNQMLMNPEMVHPEIRKIIEAFAESSERISTSIYNSADQQAAGGGSGASGASLPASPEATSLDFLDTSGGVEQGGQGGFD